MNRSEIAFPFKRYQMQPVWRADRPQKGRYREFYQCDADVVGTNSLICEVEIILMIREVLHRLGVTGYTIKINHRDILSGIAEVIEAKENETALFVAIDKLDKIGPDKVKEELISRGFKENNVTALFDILDLKGSTINKLAFLTSRFDASHSGKKGLRDLQEVLNLLEYFGQQDDHVEFDVSLARGLSYYTGCIFEVKIADTGLGSVGGGGRYDNLTASFGDKDNLSGVGFSFGVDRLYDSLEALNLFPKDRTESAKVLICHFDSASQVYGLNVLSRLRSEGIASEIYPDIVKIKKQLDYANRKMIPYALVIGSKEMESGMLACKDLKTGNQEELKLEDLVIKLKGG
jgi:histidyl-tRNA synthetase